MSLAKHCCRTFPLAKLTNITFLSNTSGNLAFSSHFAAPYRMSTHKLAYAGMYALAYASQYVLHFFISSITITSVTSIICRKPASILGEFISVKSNHCEQHSIHSYRGIYIYIPSQISSHVYFPMLIGVRMLS